MATTNRSTLNTPTIPEDITKDELSLVRSYLLLTFIHKVFERDCRVIGKSGLFKTPQLYMELVSSATKKTSLMLQEVTRELTSRNLKITTVRQDQRGVEAQYTCRGYTGEINIQWPGFRSEMMQRMRAYLGLNPELAVLPKPESVEQMAMSI
ncbi:hypothetical protein PAECIP111892_00118 [Paenibacillus auburnensis]|jgi:hypothetical protein|uniref:Uncharacterized protein n=1 Tax=Paenibacillus auburnensis TaxID=2905649 RepID=A0ABN8FV27_9BACL|nr:hypothetical protein [Paenibacillus auburnensis]CAH1190347.1 hypothetical protein PAECIP111892_00118 [Paenibacillus auburnensis]